MADLRISELSALAGSNLAGVDELAIVDDSASETKKITVADLIANGVTVISDDTIPGAKILFSAGDITTAALADSAVTTAKVADDAITAAKLADESTVDLVTTLPASGAFAGQLALDTDDNNLYAWDGSAWRSIAAPGSVANINGSTTGEINIVATTSGTSVTISATIDDTTSAAQFLAGPTGSAGAVGYRTIVGSDLPTATASAKGGVIVNGNGLTLSGDTLEIDNSVTSSATHHVVTYDANGLITGGRVITSADLPAATTTALGGVIVSDGLTVDVAGNLSIDNSVTSGTYTKVTVTAEGLVSGVDNLGADDIPDHSAAKLTSGTIGTSLIANDAITADKIANQATTKFGGAAGSDNVTIFPTGDFQGQFFYDETTQDLYIYTGSSFVPITVLSGNLVNAGAYNASTNQMSSVTSAGSSAGFSVGAALPAPAQTNLNHYVVVDTSGTGTGAAPAVALAPPDMLLSQGVGTEYSLIDVSNAIAGQTASNISFIASGNIVATDVQAALQEVDTEKIAKAGDTMTGALGIGTASSIVFEGSTADDYETTLTVTDPTADRTITFPDVTGNVVTTGDTGTVTSTMILDNTIVNADINASAEIAVSKLADGAAYQILHTDSSGTGVEWTSNLDIPGTLDVTSTATFDSTVTVTGLITANGKVSFPAGTAAAPGLYSGTDIDTGIYAPGANEFGIATAGSAALTIDSSQQVGIGTVSPSSKLHVDHDINAEAYTIIENSRNYGFGVGIDFKQPFVNAGSSIVGGRIRSDYESDNNSFFAFSTLQSGTLDERMRLDSSGRLLIGTTSSAAGRVVHASSDGSNSAYFHSTNATSGTGASDGCVMGMGSSTDAYFWNYESGIIQFGTSGSPRMTINSSGNVGIGTTSPGYKLDVTSQLGCTYSGALRHLVNIDSDGGKSYWYNGSVSNTAFIAGDTGNAYFAGSLGIGTTSPSSAIGSTPVVEISGTYGGLALSSSVPSANKVEIGNYGYNTMVFATNSSERMRIDSSGRLLLGTTTEGAANEAEDVTISGTGEVGITLRSTNSGGGRIYFSDGTSGTSEYAGYQIYNHSSNAMIFGTNAAERMRIDSSGSVLVGKTSIDFALAGVVLFNSGEVNITRDAGTPLYIRRNTSDGTLVAFMQDGNTEGSITVSGSTVSYNGAHLSRWSQLPSGVERTEILRGSVLSNLDEMCEWGDEDNEQLNRMKISDVEGDRNAAGVFQAWDDDDDTYSNDFYCAMTGDFIIRIAQGTTVERGDLLMSAGDGTAKPQDDDIVRSKTIAKVTSTNVSETYADGSYCVPCVLMAC